MRTAAEQIFNCPHQGVSQQLYLEAKVLELIAGYLELIRTNEPSLDDATTGTRTDTALRDVPQSVQVIPQQILRDQQVVRLDEALRNVSSIVGGNSPEGSGATFSIRGFAGAPVLRDEFNLASFEQISDINILAETANLERIEVLKGPASTLFGINPGGVINVVTKKPLSQPFYEAEVQICSRDFFRPRIDFSGPLTQDGKLLYRLNALAANDDGFRDFDQNIQREFVAPVLTWKISDRTDLTVELEYLDEERQFDSGLVAFGDGVVDVPRDRITGEPRDFREQESFTTGYRFEHRFSRACSTSRDV